MIIDCVADLHGCKPALHGGDLLIVAREMMISVNASIMNKHYQPVNKPVRVIL